MSADTAVREGWARLWAYGQPHYVRGGVALCGVPVGSKALTLTPQPDGGKTPCPHCERKLVAEAKGYR